MAQNNKKVIILHFQKESDQSATLRTLEKAYEKHANTDVVVTSSGSESAQIMQDYSGGLLLFSIFDKVCVSQLLMFINGCAGELKDGTVKMAGYNNLNNKKIDKYLHKNHCSEQFFGKITTKTLSYKINLWFKAIDFSVQQANEKQKKLDEQKATEIRYCGPLDLASDCWLLESKDKVHNAMKQWFIYMRGPSPCAGSWEEIVNNQDHYDKYWEWKPKLEDKFPFISDIGSWIFKGPEPKFSWKDNTWHFTGRDIYLGWQPENESKIHYRLLANNKGALLTENSDAAKFKRDMIEESCNPEYHVDSDGFYEGGDKSFEDETDYGDRVDEIERDDNSIDGHMRGDQENTNELSSHYKGKSKGSDLNLEGEEEGEEKEKSLAEHMSDIKKGLEKGPDVIDNKMRGKSDRRTELDLDEEEKDPFDELSGGNSDFSKTKGKSAGLDLEKGGKEPKDDHDDDTNPEKELAEKLKLDLAKAASESEDNDERERDEINSNMVGKGLASKSLGLEKGAPDKKETPEEKEEREENEHRAALGLPPKKKEGEPHVGEVDHLQKYYGVQKEMGLDDSLSPDLEKGEQEEKSGAEHAGLTPKERAARGLPPLKGEKQYGSEGARGKGAPQFDRDGNPREGGAPGIDPKTGQANESGVEHQDNSMMGRGMRDQIAEDDFDGEGGRADQIEKYYGTKKRQQEEDGPKKKRDLRKIKLDDPSEFIAPKKEKDNFKGKAKEFDLFGGEKVNLTDIKISVELIRKGKQSNIFDDVAPADLSDMFDEYMVVKSPTEQLMRPGEKVMIKLDCAYLGRNNFYDFTGAIEEVEDEEFLEEEQTDSFSNITVKLSKFEKKDLDTITKMFMERQANILKFFKAAKGIE